mmetsp:Transcript_1989/g.7609  ORF Transcript_1989/g.7609 Transcript_1989/m.7609 type:complete len:280 (-) Transcript_1989:904-1743(-)
MNSSATLTWPSSNDTSQRCCRSRSGNFSSFTSGRCRPRRDTTKFRKIPSKASSILTSGVVNRMSPNCAVRLTVRNASARSSLSPNLSTCDGSLKVSAAKRWKKLTYAWMLRSTTLLRCVLRSAETASKKPRESSWASSSSLCACKMFAALSSQGPSRSVRTSVQCTPCALRKALISTRSEELGGGRCTSNRTSNSRCQSSSSFIEEDEQVVSAPPILSRLAASASRQASGGPPCVPSTPTKCTAPWGTGGRGTKGTPARSRALASPKMWSTTALLMARM